MWIFDLTSEAPVNFQVITPSTPGSRDSSSIEEGAVPPTKKPYVSTHDCSRKQLYKYNNIIAASGITRNSDFTWLEYDAHCDGAFCNLFKTSGRLLERTGGIWTTKPFTNWKKADDGFKTSQVALDYQSSLHAGSVIQQLQNVAEQEQIMNRNVVKLV